MTDRVKGFVVTLEKDMRIDDVETIRKALSMIKGVADVSSSIVDSSDHMNRERIKYEFRDKFYNFINEYF